MSQARSFTIELTQAGTGKKATVKINQAGFTPQYVFKLGNSEMQESILVTNCEDTEEYNIVNNTITIPNKMDCYSIPITSYKTTVEGKKEYVVCVLENASSIDQITESRYDETYKKEFEGNFSINIDENTSYTDKTYKLILKQWDSNKKIEITLVQKGKADDGVFKADPTAFSFGAASDTKSSKITSTSKGKTVGWTVSNKSSMPSWLTISGEGTGILSANVKDNA